RILFAWENPNVPVDEVVNDVLRAFHHPSLRSESVEIQRDMLKTVKMWADEHPWRNRFDKLLGSESVKNGENHVLGQQKKDGCGGHGKVAGSLWSHVRTRDLDSMEGRDGDASANYVSSSPAPPSSQRPTQPSFSYGESASYYGNQGENLPAGPQGGYSGPSPQPGPFYSGCNQTSPPGHPQGYGGPPPTVGQWGASPPAQGYGSVSYGGHPPQYPPYQQGPHPPQQPPSWNPYPGY
ncbi:Uncharacterized protein TCAP_05741, partial [Tolypocladium capitatum]